MDVLLRQSFFFGQGIKQTLAGQRTGHQGTVNRFVDDSSETGVAVGTGSLGGGGSSGGASSAASAPTGVTDGVGSGSSVGVGIGVGDSPP